MKEAIETMMKNKTLWKKEQGDWKTSSWKLWSRDYSHWSKNSVSRTEEDGNGGGGGEVTINGVSFSLKGWNVPHLILVMASQFCGYTKEYIN